MGRKPLMVTTTVPTARGAAWPLVARSCRSARAITASKSVMAPAESPVSHATATCGGPMLKSRLRIRNSRCARWRIRQISGPSFMNSSIKEAFMPELAFDQRPPAVVEDNPNLLFTSSSWDFPMLRRIYDACYDIGVNEFGLDIYPLQIEVVTSEQMLDAYASVGLPLMYRPWSFGKRFAYHETLYRKGLQGLAYEIVVNTDPVICYIMEENSMTMQTLVMAHASMGHNHFFKNNYLFRQWTDAGAILDYLAFARDYVAKCEEEHGLAA